MRETKALFDALYTPRQITITRTLHGGRFYQLTAIFDDFQHRSRVLFFGAVVVGDTWSGPALDSLHTPRKWKNLPPPPGFDNLRVICVFILSLPSSDNLLLQTVSKTSTAAAPNNKKAPTAKEKAVKYEELKGKRAWDSAIAPAKQLPMQLVMVYFSGGGVQIFSIGMVAMLLSAPFRAFSGINDGSCFQSRRRVGIYTHLTAFAPFAPSNASNPRSFDTLLVQKIVFILCNCLTLLVGAWKCHQMGLVPVGTGDWLAFEPRGQVRVSSPCGILADSHQSPEISFQ